MSIKDRIVPIPRRYEEKSGGRAVLGVPGRADFSLVNNAGGGGLCKEAESLLYDKLRGLLGLNCKACDRRENGGVEITLSVGDPPDNIANADQGYRITVTEKAVDITGFGAAGLYYGATTVTQCLSLENGQVSLPSCEIEDWPDLRTRGHFMETRFGSNLMTLDDWKSVIDNMAGMKMNQLVVGVYGCWCVQYDGRVSEYLYLPIKKYPELKAPVVTRYWSPKENAWIDREELPPMVNDDFFGDLIQYGKKRGVTVFPLFNSYGHNTLIPSKFPEVSAKGENGEPELTGFCTRNEKTYEIMFDIYDEIIDRYLIPNGVDSFHIGLDEVRVGIAENADDIYRRRSAICKCPLCRGAKPEELYIEHAIRLMSHLKKRGMKHIYMYHDMLIKHRGHERRDTTEDMMRAIDENGLRDVAVIDWWTYSDEQENLMFLTTNPEQGLRRTVKPWNGYYHWNAVFYPIKNIYLLAKMASDEGAEGMQSYSAWDLSFDRAHVAQADYAWNFNGTGGVRDTTDSYAKARFGAQACKAKRALELFDAIWDAARLKDAGGNDTFSNRDLLSNVISYYFYSYVREGKPYPRSFPGEAVSALTARRELYGNKLLGIAAMGREAERLWNEVAADTRCDVKQARRYAWEAAHYTAMAEDFLALLEIKDVVEAGALNCDTVSALAETAAKRKAARLALMERFERVKEHYLCAGHMRNHSIYMQFFADLETYLTKTPAAGISIDFSDFSDIASPQFKKLR